MSFSDLQNKILKYIKEKFDFKAKLNEPYKLCDYRPIYNLIFKEYVEKYDFWGYCDIYLIFGNIRKFISDDILKRYDKIYTKGHLTLFKNIQEVTSAILTSEIHPNYYNFKEAFRTNYPCCFDEWGGISNIFQKSINLRQYDSIDFADILYSRYNFEILFTDMPRTNILFEWNNGVLKCYYLNNNEILEREFLYIHLQKRDMSMDFDKIDDMDSFLTLPNKFIKK